MCCYVIDVVAKPPPVRTYKIKRFNVSFSLHRLILLCCFGQRNNLKDDNMSRNLYNMEKYPSPTSCIILPVSLSFTGGFSL